jgi:tetratricopeptide (TPR) repeat protein
MPHVVNGCGTWYYGKKNLEKYEGVCRACGRKGALASYDTRLWVVVVMVPIIPLGRKRIIEDCPACRRHGVMSLDDWNRASQRAGEALDAYRRSPTDPELAKEALGACVAHRNLNAFLEIAPEIEQKLFAHADTMLRVAAVYNVFGKPAEAERALRQALQAKTAAGDSDADDMREALADCLMSQGKCDEAAPFVQHIIDKGVPDRIDSLYQLAQGYQMKGQHERALEYFQHCETINPQIANDATFVRLRDASALKRGSDRVVMPNEVVRKAKAADSRRKFARAAPIAVTIIALAYATLSFVQGSRRQVFLVNGLDKPYTVKLNGTAHTLNPHVATPARIAEGDIKVELADAATPVATETISINTPFLTRPFDQHTFVINPDHAAVIERTTVFYRANVSILNQNSGPEPRRSYVAGKALHTFDGVDYPFSEPPSRISMKSSDSEVSRDALSVLNADPRIDPLIILSSLKDDVGEQAVLEVTRRRILLDPEHGEGYLKLLYAMMEPQKLAEFLRPGLDQRPLRIQWHRIYQTILTESAQEQKLEREYESMLSKEPQNKELMYLAARVASSPDHALELLQQASSGDSPSAFALYSLGGYELENGRFQEAAEHVKKAMKMLPGMEEMKWYAVEAMIAAGQYDELLPLLQPIERGPLPGSLTAFGHEVYVHMVKGRRTEADAAVERCRAALKPLDQKLADGQAEALRSMQEYCAGNLTLYVTRLSGSKSLSDRFAAHLTMGNLDAAREDLKESDAVAAKDGSSRRVIELGRDSNPHLLIYLAAMTRSRKDLAESHLKAAIDVLAKGDRENRAYAAALRDGASAANMPLTELLRLRQRHEEKLVLLTALGLRDPAAREQCFALARQLNYDKRYPYQTIKAALDSPVSSASR